MPVIVYSNGTITIRLMTSKAGVINVGYAQSFYHISNT